LVTGELRTYVNLDYAASTPPLARVVSAVEQFLPYYSSVHRGAGYKSLISTAAYEGARDVAHSFFGARCDDAVIFTRNTTDSINLLAESLPAGAAVVAFSSEHHANLLPWQKGNLHVTYLRAPLSAEEAVDRLATHLKTAHDDLVAVTGASNVTGEVWPVGELADVAHRYGARLLLDAAQLAPHLPINITELDADYMVASGHKIYAPFGAGVLIGRPDWLRQSAPFLRGGGAVDFVTTDEVLWTVLPARQEAGSPNVVGAVALGAALETLEAYGMEKLAAEEAALASYARQSLTDIPTVDVYGLWGAEAERIGVVTFNVRSYEHSQIAAILSAEFGIGVRHGCFCAHPLMLELMQVDAPQAAHIRDLIRQGNKRAVPGAVRISIGLGTTEDDIRYLVEALRQIVSEGPHWTYVANPEDGDFAPDPDPRRWPDLLVRLSHEFGGAAESS
jgi:selenocysteine lyase/cysteine desulfurase